jgi:hypothetical protein
MGLDARVYCNCFETGKIKESPPESVLVFVTDDGSLECKSEDLDILLAFDQWLRFRACAHQDGILVHHRIGNIALVELLHKELKVEVESYPILLERVLYSGAHTGDYLAFADVENLRAEINNLSALQHTANQSLITTFQRQMQELVAAALSTGNPISF